MSILIKGMEMPQSCDKCIYSAWSNFYQIYVCDAVRDNEPVLFDGKQTKSTDVVRSARADNCPLVLVPPHGRLIDADALKEAFCGNCFADEKPMECSEPCMYMRIILETPTIIPAEEGET